ncbi:stomatin-like isoform X3 [Teleopsis dalmanni]|uniref:stomatin-like isoform X3 n=1 Tax=Teleopsis dalmanni TaxID=139649 RepID=UPI0018CDCD6A|nr:stomatin-like isoform X3 [Teleopsis dalmanni]
MNMSVYHDLHEFDSRNIITSERQESNLSEQLLYILSILLMVVTFPISMAYVWICPKEYERVVIFRLGRLRIEKPLLAVIQVERVGKATQLLAQTTLRKVAGTKMLVELLTDREAIANEVSVILDEGTTPWGVKVEHVEIKDVRIPRDLQRALAAESEAIRMAKAKIVAAEGELKASLTLKEASDIMSENTMTVQLRYLQTLCAIAGERNHTIIFPFPTDFLNNLFKN